MERQLIGEVLLAEGTSGTAWVVVLAWIGALGAAVGSFLNVVIYRWPAGKSVVSPGSRCPACERPIRAWDNVPILSWLVLRGRCRDCGAGISARYFLIEVLMAALFVAIAVVDLGGGVEFGKREMAACALHVALAASLVAAAVAVGDGRAGPAVTLRMVGPVAVAGAVLNVLWSDVRELTWGGMDVVFDVKNAAATVGAMVFGAVAWFPATKAVAGRDDRYAAAWCLLASAAVQGARTAGFVIVFGAAIYFLASLGVRKSRWCERVSLTAAMAMVSLAAMVVPAVGEEFRRRPYDGPLAVWVVLAALVALAIHQSTRFVGRGVEGKA